MRTQRLANRRRSGAFGIRRGKNTRQPDDVRADRTVRFVFENNGIVARHVSVLRFLDASVLENPVQQARADFLLRMNRNSDDPFGLRVPELTMATLPAAKFFESMLAEQTHEFRPRHRSIFKPNVGFVKPRSQRGSLASTEGLSLWTCKALSGVGGCFLQFAFICRGRRGGRVKSHSGRCSARC